MLAGKGQVQKLPSMVKQRWTSLPILLSRVLQHLDAIKATCGRAGFECSFWKQEQALVEIYSIVHPVANFINLCQASMMSASERTSRVWSSARMVATCPT